MQQENPGIYASFSLEPVQMAFASEKAGRPIFENREFVRIVIAGDKHTEVFKEATQADKERFWEPYGRFQRGLKGREQMTGTPLSQWTYLTPARVKEFEGINIFTVEEMAALSDTVKQKIGMGANEVVAAAQAYLATARDGAAAAGYAAENERLKSEIEMLKTQVQDLASMLEARDNELVDPSNNHARSIYEKKGRPRQARENTLEL